MIRNNYNRYEIFTNDTGDADQLPFVEIPVALSDKYEVWNEGINRYDKYSQKYYNDPFYDFFILFANPEYISEFDIPDGTLIRIPFPLDRAKKVYEDGLKRIKNQ